MRFSHQTTLPGACSDATVAFPDGGLFANFAARAGSLRDLLAYSFFSSVSDHCSWSGALRSYGARLSGGNRFWRLDFFVPRVVLLSGTLIAFSITRRPASVLGSCRSVFLGVVFLKPFFP